jgi:hypothetical protein
MIAKPPDVTGTPMERFEKILKRVVTVPKPEVGRMANRERGKTKKKSRIMGK